MWEYMRQSVLQIVLFLCFILALGCGYRFSGTGTLPENAENLCIMMLDNKTGETGLENRITDALIVEFSRGNIRISKDSDGADVILSGVITKMTESSVTRTQEKRITLWVDMQLTAQDGRVVWSGNGISDNRVYNNTNDSGVTETREDALEALSERIAELVYQGMTDDF